MVSARRADNRSRRCSRCTAASLGVADLRNNAAAVRPALLQLELRLLFVLFFFLLLIFVVDALCVLPVAGAGRMH